MNGFESAASMSMQWIYCTYLSLMISVRQAHNGHLLGSSAVVLRDEVVKAFMAIVADSQSVSSCCGAVNVVV